MRCHEDRGDLTTHFLVLASGAKFLVKDPSGNYCTFETPSKVHCRILCTSLEMCDKHHVLLSNLLLPAKILIAQYWKTEKVPSIYEWQQIIFLMNKVVSIAIVK